MDRSVEIVIDDKINVKGERMLMAMFACANEMFNSVVHTKEYAGNSDILVLYGFGSEKKKPWFDAHRKSGRIAVGVDLGYYGRHTSQHYPMRITINREHPVGMLSQNPDPARWDSEGMQLRNDANPDGHIVLVGMGRKSRWQYGIDGTAWERKRLEQIRARFPGVKIVYRPKPGATERIDRGIKHDSNSPIESIIRGARLVVVRHSNVAVDACIAGVPVVCEDGAATYLYGSDLCNPVNPTMDERLRFLRALAHWQYRPNESRLCWQHILSVSTSVLDARK